MFAILHSAADSGERGDVQLHWVHSHSMLLRRAQRSGGGRPGSPQRPSQRSSMNRCHRTTRLPYSGKLTQTCAKTWDGILLSKPSANHSRRMKSRGIALKGTAMDIALGLHKNHSKSIGNDLQIQKERVCTFSSKESFKPAMSTPSAKGLESNLLNQQSLNLGISLAPTSD